MKGCKYSSRCGGCVDIGEDISTQLSRKSEYIRNLFKDINCNNICECVGDYYPYKYRNKVHLAFKSLKGKTIIGFFEEGSNKVTDVDGCLLFGDWLGKLIAILREYVSRFKIRPYDKFDGGIIRYAHTRCIDDKLQLTLVVTTTNFGGRDWLYEKLSSVFKEVSLYLNINRRTDNAVFDNVFKFVKGNRYLNFNICGVNVSLSPNSFLQINLNVASKMYKEAMKMLDISDTTTVVDLYSGIGITSVLFGKVAKGVVAIEEVPTATENAKVMCRLNGVNNVTCLCGKCEDRIDGIKKDGDFVVFVDPARAGMKESVIKSCLSLNPRHIVYMSCNPETCVRDIKIFLNDRNYMVADIKPYNIFPYTKHVEVLVHLKRKMGNLQK